MIRAGPLNEIDIDELLQHRVWRFLPESAQRDETWVSPVRGLPVSSLTSCVVVLEAELANGERLPAMLSNIDTENADLNEHFVTVSLFRPGKGWFHLARYHDIDAEERGPTALGKWLELGVEETFPITVRLDGVLRRDHPMLELRIASEPDQKLTRSELIRLSLL